MLESVPLDGICVARIPLLPLEISESLMTHARPLEALRELLAARSDCRVAIFLASSDLYRAMNDWLAGNTPKNPKMPSKLLAYVLRMSARSTPFGMFAGVAEVRTGSRQTLAPSASRPRRVRFRPDAAWLQHRIAPVFADPRRRDELRVVASDAYREHDGRLFVTSFATHDDGDVVTLHSPSSLRKTAAVDAALRTSESGVGYGELVTQLATTFAVTPATSRRLVDDMWSCGLLIPALRPSPLVVALDHVIAHLPATEHELRTALETDRARLQRLGETVSVPEAEVVAVVSAMREAAGMYEHAVQADSGVALDGTLHAAVLDEAAQLGALLLRNGGSMRMTALEEAWQRRFDSPGVLVPLMDVLDPDVGLGDARLLEIAWSERANTDGVRLAAVAEALASGAEEIVLSPADCARWFPAQPDRASAPPTMEVAFTLAAASAAAVDAGDFRIAATPLATSTAGRTVGRFSDLAHGTIDRVREALLPAAGDTAIHAELVYAPDARGANVSTRAPVHPYVIAFGLAVDAGERLGLHDLFAGRDESGFFLYSRSHGKRVIPHESHVMTISATAPPVCRFLALLARQQFTPSPFAWGAAAEHVPALPRVRAGRIILSPRRWRLPAELFAGSADDAVAAIRAWRERWNCPAQVRFGDGDRILPVNLERPEFVDLIRDVRGTVNVAPVLVYEIVETSSTSAVRDASGGYAAEFVTGLATRVAGAPPPAPAAPKPFAFGMPPQFGLGSDYAYVKLYCAAHRMDRAIVGPVAPALEALIASGIADRWFFIRYADPEPHLRVRVHAAGDAAALRAALFDRTEAWLHSGWCSRVVADTYVPETARYGGIDVLPLIERAFMESSRACCAALVPAPAGVRERMRRGALTALELFAPLVRRLGTTWWMDVFAERAPPRDRLFREDRAAIAAASANAGDGGTAGSLDALLDAVAIDDAAAIVPPLLHMHLNRIGIAPADEAIVRDLIRQRYASDVARMRTTVVTRDT